MVVLVTGGSGFLGRALARLLLARGDSVLSVDLAPDRGLLGAAGYTFLPAEAAWFETPVGAAPAAVVALAQSPRYREFPAGAEDLFAVNVAGVFRALEVARQSGAARFILASTGSVYTGGGTDAAPLTEASPTGVDSFYAASKLAAEHFARAYAPLFDLAVLRPFFLYGPGQRGMMIPNLAGRIVRGEPVTLDGDEGGMRFSPLHVDDAAAIVAGLLARPAAPGRHEIYNLGGAASASVREAAEALGAALGRAPRFERTGRPARHLVADSAKVYAAAGVRPAVPLAAGLAAVARELAAAGV